ncbi:helix-turn-helix transcriptional regulator [Cytobacillus firmus]|uniref:helix-turn-helix domain-containing protein n=2 Tax=Cytobacillus firmus TaxID=1399 RepID=UPI001331253C|nr:helix-turn-helix transcriptional regulator [Cytobacillus firmus]
MGTEKALSLILKKYRKQRSLSQEELALRCNLDRTFISLIERGKRRPTLNTILILASGLEVKASVIVQEVEKLIYENSEEKDTNK